MSSRPQVVVIGGNFAGLSAARALSPRQFQVTVLDPGAHFEWLPHIHELLSRHKKADQLRHDRQELVERAGHAFIRQAVIAIDRPGQRVQLANGQWLAYDQLIVALGNVGILELVPGARQHALPFGTIAEAERAALQLQRLDSLNLPLRPVVLVGASIEGIEVLGELVRRFRRQWRFQLHVIEARTTVMGHYRGLDAYLREQVRDLDIHWHIGRTVSAVGKDSVTLDSGQVLPSRATLWCAGALPHPLLADAGLAPARHYAPVHATLQSTVDPRVWLAGDTVAFPTPVDKQAYHALPMGALIGKNLTRARDGRGPRPFRPLPIPSLMSFGDTGFLLFKSHALATPGLIAAKEAVFQANFNLLRLPREAGDWQQLKFSLGASASSMGQLASRAWRTGTLLHARHFPAQQD